MTTTTTETKKVKTARVEVTHRSETREYGRKQRVFVRLRDDLHTLEQLLSRHLDPTCDPKEWRKGYLGPLNVLVERALRANLKAVLGREPREGEAESLKIRWSAKAGCSSCPCSPGYILDVEGADVHVDVNGSWY